MHAKAAANDLERPFRSPAPRTLNDSDRRFLYVFVDFVLGHTITLIISEYGSCRSQSPNGDLGNAAPVTRNKSASRNWYRQTRLGGNSGNHSTEELSGSVAAALPPKLALVTPLKRGRFSPLAKPSAAIARSTSRRLRVTSA